MNNYNYDKKIIVSNIHLDLNNEFKNLNKE